MDFEISQRKTDGKWIFYYFAGNSKKTRICRGCKTREEAEAYAAALGKKKLNVYLVKEIAKDMFCLNGEHILRLQGFGRKLDEKTILQKRYVTNLICKDFGEKDIRKIPIRDIENFLINDKKHSGSWKNFYLETFASIYEETKWKCPVHVPKPRFQRFLRNSKKADILSTEELAAILRPECWKAYPEYILFSCIAACGLRIGEARALQLKQFLFDEKILIINGFCKYDGTKTNYNKKGSADDDKIRVVPIPDSTINIIKKYLISKEIIDGNAYLFTDKYGCPLTQRHLEDSFKTALKKAGILTNDRKIVPHSLRFTYVTRMRRGLSIEKVQRIVGHSSIEMTQYYTRSSIPELIAAVQGSFEQANNLFIDSK